MASSNETSRPVSPGERLLNLAIGFGAVVVGFALLGNVVHAAGQAIHHNRIG